MKTRPRTILLPGLLSVFLISPVAFCITPAFAESFDGQSDVFAIDLNNYAYKPTNRSAVPSDAAPIYNRQGQRSGGVWVGGKADTGVDWGRNQNFIGGTVQDESDGVINLRLKF